MSSGIEVSGAEAISRRLRAVADIADHIETEYSGAICETMRRTADERLRDLGAIDTGALLNSVKTTDAEYVERVDETTVSMGISTTVPYAMFIEYGTGPLGDPEVPHTEKMQWVYPSEDGFRVAHSQPARPFMRPALYDNRKAFLKTLRTAVKDIYARS